MLNDSIYAWWEVLGTISPYGKDVRFYTPETEVGTSLPDMIYDRPTKLSVEIIDNKIYVIGGTSKTEWNDPTGKERSI